MKKLITLLALLVSINSYSQTIGNADQVSQGVVHQFAPRTNNSVQYFNSVGVLQSAVLASGQAMVGNTGSAPTPQIILTSDSLLPYQQALTVPSAGTFASPPTEITSDGVFHAHEGIIDPEWTAQQVLTTNDNGKATSIGLEEGQVLGGGSGGAPSAIELEAESPVTIDKSLPGTIKIGCPGCGGGGGGTVQTIPLIFNAGGGGLNPEVGVNATATVDSLGRATITIPEFEGLTVNSAGQAVTTSTSTYAAPVPAAFCPAFPQESPSVMILTGATQDTSGLIIVGAPAAPGAGCDITLCLKNSSCAYPSGSGVTAGFSAFGAQTISYSTTADADQGRIVSTSSTGGTITPPVQIWTPGDTPTMVFTLTPSSGNSFESATDTCDGGLPSGAPSGTPLGSTYTLSNVTRNCTVSATFAPAYTISTNLSGPGAGTISPTSANWFSGTSSKTFTIEPAANGYIFGATDNCNGGSPGGAPSGSDYIVTTANQNCTVDIVFNTFLTVNTAATTNGSISPSPGYWYNGSTSSLPFTLTPASGYEIDTVTDTCFGGSPAGSLSGDIYTIGSSINQTPCLVTATFKASPFTVSTQNLGNGDGSYSPSSAVYAGSPLSFSAIRDPGFQWNPLGTTDNCNGGSPGGSVAGNTYVVSTVTQNCTVSGPFYHYSEASYLDFTASGSLASVPTLAYGSSSEINFGFPDITTTTMASAYITAISTAVFYENPNTQNYLAIGGEGGSYASFAAVGFPTVVSNVLAQIAQINTAIAPTAIVGVVLDLEGAGWNPTDIQTLINDFHAENLYVKGAPQIYYTGSNSVSSAIPTNMILTAGAGTGNTYSAVSDGSFDSIEIQTYNSGGWTIDSKNEADAANFFQAAAAALSTATLDDCTGVTTICIKKGTGMLIGQVANAGAGGYTIFNDTGVFAPIPAYDQAAILATYSTSIGAGLTASPLINGLMMWSMNNDYAPLLYNATDSATSGNYTQTIYDSLIFKDSFLGWLFGKNKRGKNK